MTDQLHPHFPFIDNPMPIYRYAFEEYVKIAAANASGLKKILRSPAHYLYARQNPGDQDTAALVFGRVLHLAFLETQEFRDRVHVYPDFGTGKGSRTSKWDWEESVRAEFEDAILVKQDDMDRVVAIVDSLRRHKFAAEILTEGAAEVTLLWNDEKHGMACKARVDYLVKKSRPVFADLKTTKDASYDAFSRAAFTYAYDLAAAHYSLGGKAVFGVDPMFVFIAVEHEPPHGVQVFVATESLIDIGLSRRERAMRRLRESIEAQAFPAYSTEPVNLHLPHYAFYDEESQL